MEVSQIPEFKMGLTSVITLIKTFIKCAEYDDKKDYNNPHYKVDDYNIVKDAYKEIERLYNKDNPFLKCNMNIVKRLKYALLRVILLENSDVIYGYLKVVKEVYDKLSYHSGEIGNMSVMCSLGQDVMIELLEEHYKDVVIAIETLTNDIITKEKSGLSRYESYDTRVYIDIIYCLGLLVYSSIHEYCKDIKYNAPLFKHMNNYKYNMVLAINELQYHIDNNVEYLVENDIDPEELIILIAESSKYGNTENDIIDELSIGKIMILMYYLNKLYEKIVNDSKKGPVFYGIEVINGNLNKIGEQIYTIRGEVLYTYKWTLLLFKSVLDRLVNPKSYYQPDGNIMRVLIHSDTGKNGIYSKYNIDFRHYINMEPNDDNIELVKDIIKRLESELDYLYHHDRYRLQEDNVFATLVKNTDNDSKVEKKDIRKEIKEELENKEEIEETNNDNAIFNYIKYGIIGIGTVIGGILIYKKIKGKQ